MMHGQKERIVRISGGSVFLAENYSLPMSCTSLDPNKMRFRPGKDFFWKTEITGYDPLMGRVELKVLDYNPIEISGFAEQKMKAPVKYIQFEALDWNLLEPQLAFYHYNHLLHMLDDGDNEAPRVNQVSDSTAVGRLGVSEEFQPFHIQSKESTKKEVLQENFRIFFNDATFLSGRVQVIRKFAWYPEPLCISIENSNLIPEFDLIKVYFPKVFGGLKKFEVQARFELEDRQVKEISAFSPQIARIDDALIEGVKRAQVMAYISRTAGTIDKSLFTADEFMGHYAEDEEKGNALKQTEADIILASMADKSLRNRKQIEFLAGSQQSAQHKIRFTLKPVFGFVFFVEGDTMNHFCWELLNSHATYLWSFYRVSGTAMQHYKKVEQIIASIRESGREQYKSAYRTMPVEPEMHFNVINHTHAGSSLVDNFPEWKHRLLERLI
jgi:hypothetical protein